MEYVYHDGVVLRRNGHGTPIEINSGSEWRPYPEPSDDEIRGSSIEAWFEGRILTESEANGMIAGMR